MARSDPINNDIMVVATGLLRIFWPSDSLQPGRGVLVGWRNSPLDIFVACVLQDVEVKPLRFQCKDGC